jgi:hypothetical protein
MKIEDIHNELKNKELSKDSIVRLIDLKTNSDMKEVISAIDKFRIEVDSFKSELNTKLDTSIGALREGILSNRSENKFTQWLVIALFTVVSIAIAVGVFNFKK